jgi:NAD(P)H-flavin reductase
MAFNAEKTSAAIIDPMLPAPFLVDRVRRNTRDTFTLDLVPGEGVEDLRFAPGQFNMLYVFGTGEVAISISGDPACPRPLVHTIRAVGTVTNALARLRQGDLVGVRGPFGTPWPVAEAAGNDVVIVAGGVGLPPLRPVIYHVLANRATYGRVALLYGSRSPEDIVFRRELEGWRSRLDIEVRVTVDHAPTNWHGDVGVVTRLIRSVNFDPLNTIAMTCGPDVMMRYTAAELRSRGVAEENIYVSMERNMKCAVGFCGHCQLGPTFVCKDGPVFRADRIGVWSERREV